MTPEELRKIWDTPFIRTKVARSQRGDNGCIVWTGAKNVGGYGRIQCDQYHITAHRLVLILAGIDIPNDLVVDHTCRNRLCVNVSHLRIVTNAVNSTENSISPAALNYKKTKCKNGHPFDTFYVDRGKTKRRCSICYQEFWKKMKVRRHAKVSCLKCRKEGILDSLNNHCKYWCRANRTELDSHAL